MSEKASRYSIIGVNTQGALSLGGLNPKEAHHIGITFINLTDKQARELSEKGYRINKVDNVTTGVLPPAPAPVVPGLLYKPSELSWASGLENLRTLWTPPLYGNGVRVAVLDTGIRASHELLCNRVEYSESFCDSQSTDDVFDHGTAVASVVIAIAPAASLLNMKVINDSGSGTEESVVMAIDRVVEMYEEGDWICPPVINMSLGAPDDGNSDNAMRVACREAISRGIWMCASAGNEGPDPQTISCPACEQYVAAVGSASLEPFALNSFSSRGPTISGLTKPDMLFFGENVEMASSVSDIATDIRSGTSFSCPFVAGFGVLAVEGFRIGAAPNVQIIDLPPGSQMQQGIMREALDTFVPLISVKPEGITSGKDNDYGWGLPVGTLARDAMSGAAIASEAIGILPVMMMMMMTGKMFE